MEEAESSKKLVAFASIDGLAVDQHFGHARFWQIYDLNNDAEFVETRKMPALCSGTCHGNFGSAYELLHDCSAIFVLKIGQPAAAYMINRGIKVFEAAGSIDQLVLALKENDFGKDV